jgi:hypothetical protein
MIHAAILPHEDLWRRYVLLSFPKSAIHWLQFCRFLKNLKIVAVDELHYVSVMLPLFARLFILKTI